MDSQELYQQLMEAFRIEAKERIESMFSSLTTLEKTSVPESQKKMLEVVYREAHSLKGAARSVNIPAIETLCQSMEEIFSQIKAEKISFSAELFDILHVATHTIEKFLFSSESDHAEIESKIEGLIQSFSMFKDFKSRSNAPDQNVIGIKQVAVPSEAAIGSLTTNKKFADEPGSINADEKPSLHQSNISQSQSPPFPKSTSSDTVRISNAKLDSLLLKTEELIAVKQMLIQHFEQLKKANEMVQLWKIQSKKTKLQLKEIGITADSHGTRQRFYQMVEANNRNIETISSSLKELSSSLEQNNRLLGGMVDNLLEEVKSTSLLPFSSLFAVLPRMVRDIARAQAKEIDIEISGDDIEVDKRILEALKDPIIHLIRNSIDHGIEGPQKRRDCNKPALGKIRIAVTQPEGQKVQMAIEDDGSGINIDSIKKIAVKKGIVTSEHADVMDDDEALALIFQSGISTTPIITEISGRGLGMAIVKETIENLGGSINITNKVGQGATFLITLPVTIATFRGILVSISGQLFILPNAQVEHILILKKEDIHTAENRAIVSFNESVISLINMGDLLGLPTSADSTEKKAKKKKLSIPAIVMTNGDVRIAVSVDEIINEQEVLVKNLGKQIKQLPNISGTTILGTGKVVPILNVKGLIKAATQGEHPIITMDSEMEQKSEPSKSILVVEDSFTSRTLLKNILEASGYSVRTAVDGEDGFKQIKSMLFDAVVSDVQMPKMDGFRLTQKIRGHKEFSHIPVVLVTSLDSPADREKGIDVGANAYIVKSNFDQSNLLEVLERLI